MGGVLEEFFEGKALFTLASCDSSQDKRLESLFVVVWAVATNSCTPNAQDSRSSCIPNEDLSAPVERER